MSTIFLLCFNVDQCGSVLIFFYSSNFSHDAELHPLKSKTNETRMPIDDSRVAITLRLQTAYAETLESYTRKPAWIELLRQVALAQQWLTIGAAYSGIE